MILFIDTETSGLPNFNERARHESQPHIVQLATMLTRDDGEVVESHNVIIKPDGWTIPKEVSDVHGITDEIAQIGISERLAATLLFDMVKKANTLVAHNIQFDKFIARIALRRFDLFTDAEDAWWKAIPTFCTMREMTDICCLPSPKGRGFKFPKLTEAYEFAFKKQLNGAHSALADLTACKELYFWIKKGGVA